MKAPHNVNRSSITKERFSMDSVQSSTVGKDEERFGTISGHKKKRIKGSTAEFVQVDGQG